MSLAKLIFQLIKGGKRGIALIGIILVYVLNKYFGIQTTETVITEQIMMLVGAVGVLHGIWKSEIVQAAIKKFKEEKKK